MTTAEASIAKMIGESFSGVASIDRGTPVVKVKKEQPVYEYVERAPANIEEPGDHFFHWPQLDLTSFVKNAKPGKSIEVTFPVSIGYNGGTVIDGVWYTGYLVPEPIVPKGYRLNGIGCGLKLHVHPPLATQMLIPIAVNG